MGEKYWVMENPEGSYLYHHGIKGQQWGVRRYQNPDGSYTDAGKKRYFKTSGLTSKQKKTMVVVAAIVANSLLAYGSYKITTSPKTRAVVSNILYGSKEKRLSDISAMIENSGPKIIKKKL